MVNTTRCTQHSHWSRQLSTLHVKFEIFQGNFDLSRADSLPWLPHASSKRWEMDCSDNRSIKNQWKSCVKHLIPCILSPLKANTYGLNIIFLLDRKTPICHRHLIWCPCPRFDRKKKAHINGLHNETRLHNISPGLKIRAAVTQTLLNKRNISCFYSLIFSKLQLLHKHCPLGFKTEVMGRKGVFIRA